jgi:hypothetical protein
MLNELDPYLAKVFADVRRARQRRLRRWQRFMKER